MTAPPIAKSPLSSVSTGPWYKNVVRGTLHVVRMNPGGWFKQCSLNSQGKGYLEI